MATTGNGNIAKIGLTKLFPGCIVKCTTFLNEQKQGEVIMVDFDLNLIVLKSASSSGKSELNDICMINIEYIEKLELLEKIEAVPHQLLDLNTGKLLDRFKDEVSLKQCLAKARSLGVNDDGIMLFTFLRKVMPVNTIAWTKQSILVMDEVLINSPYYSENCVLYDQNNLNTQCLNHVKKTVERFHKEEKKKSV